MGIPVVHEELTADLRTMFQQAIGILSTEEQREFHRLQGAAYSRIPEQMAPVETIASIVIMYEVYPWVPYWDIILWHMAQTYKFWLTAPKVPPPCRIQINCGGLGG